jgi:ankyrin repeat protein
VLVTLNEGWGTGKITPLYMATDWGSQKVFDYLIANGAKVDIPDRETGMTPLVRAIAHNRKSMVVALLKAGASAKQIRVIDGKETHLLAGGSPLLYAITGKDVDPMLVRYLFYDLALRKEVYQQGRTPYGGCLGPTRSVPGSIEAGADQRRTFGESVLHHLVDGYREHPELASVT